MDGKHHIVVSINVPKQHYRSFIASFYSSGHLMLQPLVCLNAVLSGTGISETTLILSLVEG